MTAPRYQSLTDIPEVDGVRVIAGEYAGIKGPAETFTPVTLLLASVHASHPLSLHLKDGYSAGLYIVDGVVTVNGEKAQGGELVVLSRQGDEIQIAGDATVFIMNGAPIDEPVAGYGPFVMNTPREIQQAFADFHAGRLGTIPDREKVT
jgi:redox-sensitive bicupin YhaK (pirin superfamily)